MKTPRFLLLGLLLLACCTLPLAAQTPGPRPGGAKGGGGKGGKQMPSAQLQKMMDTTLPKLAVISNPKQPAFNRTALIELQADYTAKAQVAPPAEQPMYAAALAVVNNLLGAVEEHEKAVADYRYSKNLHGAQDRQDAKVANWQRGWDAGAAARADNAKQKMENADSRKALLDKEKFLSNGAIASWTTRYGQLHDIVEQSFSTQLVAEKQLAMGTPATPGPVAPAPKPAPAASAAQQYSPAGAWKAPRGNWTLNEDGTFSTAIGTKGTWQWSDQAKREIGFTWKNGNKGTGTLSADGKGLEVTNPNGAVVKMSR